MAKALVDETMESDVLVIGAGLAGTRASIALRNQGLDTILVDKGTMARSGCSTFAAGVITVMFPQDDPDAWMQETVTHGQFMNDQEWVKILYEEGYERIGELTKWGVEFERNKDGDIRRILGRGQLPHKALRNIMFHGTQFMNTMRREVLRNDTRVVGRVTVTDLLRKGDRVCGAIGFNPQTSKWYLFKAKAVILAAGSNCFKTLTLGHKNITGDAHGMAFRAGAEHTCFEFGTQQSCARNFDLTGLNMFVGLGAKFVNRNDVPFMEKYYPEYKDQEIIPNVAGAMAMEIKKGNGPLFLDMRHFTNEQVEMMGRVVPRGMHAIRAAGLDIQKDKIEWVARGGAYTIASGGGGLVIDHQCRSNVPGLWAIGDSACTTVYNGVGDSGGQNLLWCLVSAVRAAKSAVRQSKDIQIPKFGRADIVPLKERALFAFGKGNGIAPSDLLLKMQKVLFPWDVTIIRHEKRLNKALGKIEAMVRDDLPNVYARDSHEINTSNEVKNMLLCAEMVLRSALYRKETRGGNFREDYPHMDNENWLKWVIVKPREDGSMELTSRPIPIDRYPFKPEQGKVTAPIFAVKE